MRLLLWLLAAALAGVAVLGLVVRLAPDDPERWHVDPLTAPGTGEPNAWRVVPEDAEAPSADAVAPIYPVPAALLARAFDAVAMAQPRTVRLAGSPESLHATYVQRSRLWRFPDYVSVRFYDLSDGGSTFAAFSRARYGKGDMGVNRARLERWLAALDASLRFEAS
jgi:uncharacterized protein (DUF1499 family)